MLELVLKADDPVIGKISESSQRWPATDVVGQPYNRTACTCYSLPAPVGEHWFVVLPENVSEFSVTLEKPKKVKAAE